MTDPQPYSASYFTGESAKVPEQFIAFRGLLASHGLDPVDMTTCDLGCAEGAVFRSPLRGSSCYGVDVSEHAVQRCRDDNPGIADHFAVVDLNSDAPDFDVEFDLVTAFDVLEHLDSGGPMKQFLAKRLRPGGHLLLTTPNAMSPVRMLGRPYSGDLDPTHVQLYTRYTLDFWLTRAGLERVELLAPFIFSRRLDSRLSRLGLGGALVALYRRPESQLNRSELTGTGRVER